MRRKTVVNSLLWLEVLQQNHSVGREYQAADVLDEATLLVELAVQEKQSDEGQENQNRSAWLRVIVDCESYSGVEEENLESAIFVDLAGRFRHSPAWTSDAELCLLLHGSCFGVWQLSMVENEVVVEILARNLPVQCCQL
jgi:hypothetical protein